MLWNSSDQADSLWSPSAKFWPFPALWLVEKFPCSSRQTAQEIDLKLDGFIHYHYATPQAWLTFGLGLINFWSRWILTFFLTSDCDRSSSSINIPCLSVWLSVCHTFQGSISSTFHSNFMKLTEKSNWSVWYKTKFGNQNLATKFGNHLCMAIKIGSQC